MYVPITGISQKHRPIQQIFQKIHNLHRIILKITNFFNKIKIKNIHHITQTIYHLMMMIIINQIFLHHILKNIAHRDFDNLKHLKI